MQLISQRVNEVKRFAMNAVPTQERFNALLEAPALCISLSIIAQRRNSR
jgi:hypothetical protein